MTTLEKVLKIRNQIFKKSISIIEKKGRDYNRKQQKMGDTLFNLTVSKQLGITDTTTQGILTRLSDKFMRLISLTKNPNENPAVTGESVRDTVIDVHNYIDYLYIKYLEERGEL